MKKQFSDFKKLTGEAARKPKLLKTTFSNSANLITQYNPLLPNLKAIIRNHLPILRCNQQMLDIFLQNTISVTCKRNYNLTEILSPSLFPTTTKQNECSIKECNRKCDNCKNLFIVSPDFTCFSTKRKYKIKGILKCGSRDVICVISSNVVASNTLGLPLVLKKDLEFTKVIETLVK